MLDAGLFAHPPRAAAGLPLPSLQPQSAEKKTKEVFIYFMATTNARDLTEGMPCQRRARHMRAACHLSMMRMMGRIACASAT